MQFSPPSLQPAGTPAARKGREHACRALSSSHDITHNTRPSPLGRACRRELGNAVFVVAVGQNPSLLQKKTIRTRQAQKRDPPGPAGGARTPAAGRRSQSTSTVRARGGPDAANGARHARRANCGRLPAGARCIVQKTSEVNLHRMQLQNPRRRSRSTPYYDMIREPRCVLRVRRVCPAVAWWRRVPPARRVGFPSRGVAARRVAARLARLLAGRSRLAGSGRESRSGRRSSRKTVVRKRVRARRIGLSTQQTLYEIQRTGQANLVCAWRPRQQTEQK